MHLLSDTCVNLKYRSAGLGACGRGARAQGLPPAKFGPDKMRTSQTTFKPKMAQIPTRWFPPFKPTPSAVAVKPHDTAYRFDHRGHTSRFMSYYFIFRNGVTVV